MKVLVHFTEVISDNHQGGSGKVFDRKTIMQIDGAMMADRIFQTLQDQLREFSHVYYDPGDKRMIKIQSVEIFE